VSLPRLDEHRVSGEAKRSEHFCFQRRTRVCAEPRSVLSEGVQSGHLAHRVAAVASL
jgi:hypothetical protein